MCDCWVPCDCLYISLIPLKLLYADKKSLSRMCGFVTFSNDNNDITHRERARKREHPTDDEKIHKTLKTSPDSDN
uniref:Uncharacterized protein n=1 Tax=Timema poppense TaxID=170557 RepID=A0A7R9CJK0_TIMPO|nr:unnamed protein product [Timema poppensis]